MGAAGYSLMERSSGSFKDEPEILSPPSSKRIGSFQKMGLKSYAPFFQTYRLSLAATRDCSHFNPPHLQSNTSVPYL
jgi:hypothetical protein